MSKTKTMTDEQKRRQYFRKRAEAWAMRHDLGNVGNVALYEEHVRTITSLLRRMYDLGVKDGAWLCRR